MRVLILALDVFSAEDDGQACARGLIESHPAWTFHYPSDGRDLRAGSRLAGNARPFGFDRFWSPAAILEALACDSPEERAFAVLLAQVAVPLQGQLFDRVEVPSRVAAHHLVRPVLAAFGIVVGTVSRGGAGAQAQDAPSARHAGTDARAARATAAAPLDQAPARIWRSLPPPPPTSGIDVIVRAAGGGRALALTLLSLRAASAAPPGVIVVNDGMDDRAGVAATVRAYHPAAALVMQGGRGAALAFSRGLAASEASYVCFLTAGECVEPDALLRLRARLEAAPAAAAAFGGWWEVDATGRPVAEQAGAAAYARALAVDPGRGPGPGVLVRRAAVLGLDTSLDALGLADLWLRLGRAGPVEVDGERVAWRWQDEGPPPAPVDAGIVAAFLRRIVLACLPPGAGRP
ncbi:hypothetical protein OPKNFCMD_1252 [Methylobacterium crusticola]|uniref:Glycosyltransferase 2-like domain-containing protein n=1 Tax=Methylobacterium crusticola TaxID=1697972 RepID=A0ABQ4QUF0_9HYPH|nr:glycosyltransferase family A protein [Methylobacterium crusticola]GJD48530.1 hypothetical protein OPKNFCMD_1252 [Methylobacterium crusticola]